MHQSIRKNLEEYLKGSISEIPAEFHRHMGACEECSSELQRLEEQSRLLRSLGVNDAPKDAEPRAGFYARVMERIEAQGVASIWSLFFDSPVGRGLAMASMVVALSLGVYLVSSEPGAEPEAIPAAMHGTSGSAAGGTSGGMLTGSPDANAVLVNLVTYREQ